MLNEKVVIAWLLRIRIPVFLAVLLMVMVPVSLAAEGDQGLVIKAEKIFDGQGKWYPNGILVIQDSKIVSLSSETKSPAGYRVVDYGDAVICPGLIDPYTALGARLDDSESAEALQPDLCALDVFDPGHRDFKAALACGITSVLIVPSPTNEF